MKTSLLGAVLGVAVVGTATAMPFCMVPTASAPTPASSPGPADPMAVPVLGCEPGFSMAPFADVRISEC
jgi:hypothetical protein